MTVPELQDRIVEVIASSAREGDIVMTHLTPPSSRGAW
jgi:hypothetical protein